MRLASVKQLETLDQPQGYDLVICASGYESRAVAVVKSLQLANDNITGQHRIVMAFSEHIDAHARKGNDECFRSLGFLEKLCSGSSAEAAATIISSCLGMLQNRRSARILVDITSMTRSWYGAAVKALAQCKGCETISVHFAYTPANFIEPAPDYPPNRIVGPIAGFTGNTLPDKPTALVVGLGYDRDRALGLMDYLDPQLTLLFTSNPATDDQFLERVREVNKELYSELPQNQLFDYPVNDLVATFKLLESVCNGLRHDWRVVLCSFGPKAFGLCCSLIACVYKDLSIWRVSADQHETPIDHKPLGDPLILETIWQQAGIQGETAYAMQGSTVKITENTSVSSC